MKRKKMITGMAATLFCLVFVGGFLAQGYERDGSECGFDVERTVAPSSNQLYPNANWGVMDSQTTEVSLEDLENAYYYQMIEDQYNNSIDGQMEASAPLKDQSERNKNHPSCRC